ncbi:uncharacterized protein LOC141590048 [Silene latifolia]|uniref:uncharacterized protein LOC141590048 n=1 Tax=Silene latifolia TaxID=37657 RepID=UPI003D77C1D8
MIYGDGDYEYGRVWEYAAALTKYNPGSTAIVVVDNDENPPSLFQRMYVCLKACKRFFMDPNNNIYPVAWAVVEVENRESWTWFLSLLMEDLEKEDGAGLTIISDRQKGLLEAFNIVTPKAEIRFCVRHIWANFKQQFSGPVYKEAFWKACRATSIAEFNRELEGIKFLSTKAHAYLTSIPAKHWSRHAFSTTSKTNFLMNNMCESFNVVLKEARDKPIITLMEWIRRYVMKRHYEERVGVVGYEGRVMPLVTKYLQWADDECRLCSFVHSISGEYEVTHRGLKKLCIWKGVNALAKT